MSGTVRGGLALALPRKRGVTLGSRFGFIALIGIVLASAGCAAGTRSAGLGLLPGGERLVTLVVSEDASVVVRECPPALGNVLGCQTSRRVPLTEGAEARVVKIVRYTDRIPSELAFEIDIHELCHAVAALQPIPDPCHAENNGVAATVRAARTRSLQ